jgi:hypothetical protein
MSSNNKQQKQRKNKKSTKLMSERAKTAYAQRAVGQKMDISNRVFNKTGREIRGRGAYSLQDFWNTVSTPFRHTGSTSALNKAIRSGAEVLGSELSGNSTVGKYAGNVASWLTKIMGSGTYTVKGNTVADQMAPGIATFKPSGGTVISHREFIRDVSGTELFSNSGYLLNPGNSTLFPWLSTLAANYEQYEWLGLAFEFRSTCSFSTATGNLGTVIMATDYDVLDTDFDSKRAMEIADFSGSSSPVNTFMHFVECAPKQSVLRQMYVQPGNSIAAYPDDPRFSIPGRFQFATQGMPSAFTIGELWVTYNVKLTKPTIAPVGTVVASATAIYNRAGLNSMNVIPIPIPITSGNPSFGTVTSSVYSTATYTTGFIFNGFAPGYYQAVIHSKKATAGAASLQNWFGAPVCLGGSSLYNMCMDGTGLLNTAPFKSAMGNIGLYGDTLVTTGNFSFHMPTIDASVEVCVQLWEEAYSNVTITVTRLVDPALAKKSRMRQLIDTAVQEALNGKDEVENDYTTVQEYEPGSCSSSSSCSSRVPPPTNLARVDHARNYIFPPSATR